MSFNCILVYLKANSPLLIIQSCPADISPGLAPFLLTEPFDITMKVHIRFSLI
jgi:hypothetical protein